MNGAGAFGRILRISLLPLVAGLVMAGCRDATGISPKTLPTLRHDPVVFVHGFGGTSASFARMQARFEADGWREGVELFSFTYSSTVTNAANAQAIRNHVNHVLETTGASKVDIISHGIGSLSSRFYIRFFEGIRSVEAWVSLGGPNHGTTQAKQCSFIPCQEMAIESAFITKLNAEVEGPPPVRYATWRSPCDELVLPHESARIHDAENYLTACMRNADLIEDASVYLQVRELVRRRDLVP